MSYHSGPPAELCSSCGGNIYSLLSNSLNENHCLTQYNTNNLMSPLHMGMERDNFIYLNAHLEF